MLYSDPLGLDSLNSKAKSFSWDNVKPGDVVDGTQVLDGVTVTAQREPAIQTPLLTNVLQNSVGVRKEKSEGSNELFDTKYHGNGKFVDLFLVTVDFFLDSNFSGINTKDPSQAAMPMPFFMGGPASRARTINKAVQATKVATGGNITVTRNGIDLFRIHQPGSHGIAEASVTVFMHAHKNGRRILKQDGSPIVYDYVMPMTETHMKKLHKAMEGIGNYSFRNRGGRR